MPEFTFYFYIRGSLAHQAGEAFLLSYAKECSRESSDVAVVCRPHEEEELAGILLILGCKFQVWTFEKLKQDVAYRNKRSPTLRIRLPQVIFCTYSIDQSRLRGH